MSEIVIGTIGDDASDDAAALGIALARTLGATPVVAHIRPEAWQVVGAGRVDVEWDHYLDESSVDVIQRTLARQAETFAALGVVTDVERHRSSGAGLDALAARRGAEMIVVGSAPGGVRGRISAGSTSERLLHGASVPVALAPTGYAGVAPERIERVVVAIELTDDHTQLPRLLTLARDRGVGIAVVTIIRRATRIYGSKLGPTAESDVLAALREEANAALDTALETVRSELGVEVESHVLVGDDVTSALSSFAWRPGDLLACGSSRTGPVRRVLLGDMTFRLLRGSPVPVLVVPRG